MIRIVIVDDQQLMRDGLQTILSLKQEIEVVGVASDGAEAVEVAKQTRPDLVLMDIRMPGVDGVQGTRMIREQLPETKVLILTTFNDSELIFNALDEGASGYLLKDMPADTIVQAILTVHNGGVVLPPDLTAQVVAELKRARNGASLQEQNGGKWQLLKELPEDLTEREYEVLRQLGYGLSNREIADRLVITEGTVKNHVSNIINKLGLRDRTQAAIFAVRHGITTFE
ncbi:response regulator [Effusibacillus lacus]|uniref:DNA-binding response regulator n=1 Tax=Effusibacillus lacus TaxID=1348429 RepID=A0A292YPZ3_9BACL|nr:response regulator transcription factor [Effusibacillus lacus]TCS75656.1 LuxR family two component transcriptional regulator [Effusibacillus lacus]GAX90979.1 DNA-binding response regulator [Effusibacillus lacus]